MANSTSGESVMERFLRVLEVFDARQSSLTVSAIARRAELPLTSASRLVSNMVKHGVLEKLDGGQIRVGMRIWELSYRSSPTLRLREAALPFMNDILALVGHHVNLSVLDNGQVLYIERLSAHKATRSIALVANRLPLHTCSSGYVFLAHMATDEREESIAQALTKPTAQTITDPDELRQRLNEVKRLGYAHTAGIVVPGSTGIAVPIFDAQKKVAAALNVILPSGEERIELTFRALQMAGRAISRFIGQRSSSLTEWVELRQANEGGAG